MSKIYIAALYLLFLSAVFLIPQVEHDVEVVNIEVPVRVFQDGKFVEGLKIEDFELLENGMSQTIHAVYFTEGGKIKSRDVMEPIVPALGRHFYFMFQMTEYHPRIPEALDFFFDQIFQPGDNLTVITTLNQYNLSPKALQIKSRDALVDDMQGVIRKDIQIGNSEYNSMLTDLQRIVQVINAASGGSVALTELGADDIGTSDETGLRYQLPRYRETLEKIEEIRILDEQRFLTFASHLKKQTGQKIVFFFYQREFRPEIQPSVLNRLVSLYQDQPDVIAQVQDLFQIYNRDINLRTELINQAFADSSILFNLMFFQKNLQNISGVNMREQSEDYFKIFSGIAQSTGGTVDSSQNPAAAFISASERADQCYLLYYSSSGSSGGGFNELEVNIRGRDYQVVHRKGYFSQ